MSELDIPAVTVGGGQRSGCTSFTVDGDVLSFSDSFLKLPSCVKDEVYG